MMANDEDAPTAKQPPTPEERELAEVQARRRALAEIREARLQPTAAQLLAMEKRDLAGDEAFEKLALEHGAEKIALVPTDVGPVIVRRPHMASFRKYQDQGKATTNALELLTRPCVLYPTKEEWDLMVRDLPFVLNASGDAVCVLAGVSREGAEKK